jgi:hypothetical protein
MYLKKNLISCGCRVWATYIPQWTSSFNDMTAGKEPNEIVNRAFLFAFFFSLYIINAQEKKKYNQL